MKEEINYEKMVEYKIRIFETIFPKERYINYKELNEMLKDVNKIYDNLSQIDNMKNTVEVRAKDGSFQNIIEEQKGYVRSKTN